MPKLTDISSRTESNPENNKYLNSAMLGDIMVNCYWKFIKI